MAKFKLNKKYNHKADMIQEAFYIDEKRSDFIIDEVGNYWDTLSPEKFMISKILDFIEQQDWTTIEKLYATERFVSFYTEEAIFGYPDDDLINFIVSEWKKKGTVVDEDETREYLKHMFKLLSGYNLNCLIDTLKDIDNLAEKFNEINSDEEDNEPEMTPEQMEEQKRSLLINHAVETIDKVIPNSFGIVVFGKEGYDVIAKNSQMAKLIEDTLKSGQKNFIADKEANLNFYQ